MTAIVSDARAYLGRTLGELQALLGPQARVELADQYGRMVDVTYVAERSRFPGTLYLENERVALVYVGGDALQGVPRSLLDARFGSEAVRLRSRAGKLANLWVHAEQGVAYSAQGESLDFLEVFQPRSQNAYEREIYLEPHAFIR